MQGEIRFFKSQAGYGFIQSDDGSPDTFVHIRAAPGYAELAIGQRCEFEMGTNAKTGRPCAVDVKLLPPIISPAATPRAFRAGADDLDNASSHMELARFTFMQR